jgi:phage terminase Nu1 subunit (DNA packaging protein)
MGRPKLNRNEKFTINRLGTLTGIDRRTLEKWLAGLGDGHEFTLKDFALAMQRMGAEGRVPGRQSLEDEKKRLTALQADLAEVQLAKARGEVIEVSATERAWTNICMSIRRVILTSSLPDRDKDGILAELSKATIEEIKEEQKEDTDPPASPDAK